MFTFKQHLKHYVPLYGIFAAGLICMALFSYDKFFQIATAVALSASYLTWGVIHHSIHEDFDLFVFFEYLAVSALGLVILLSLIVRA